ncbi:MAG: hypothetical protein AAB655_02750 [Patescibacteria group bacterium]
MLENGVHDSLLGILVERAFGEEFKAVSFEPSVDLDDFLEVCGPVQVVEPGSRLEFVHIEVEESGDA